MNEQAITDSIYMGPWMANTIRECDGKVEMMSYWTFSDVFEEQGVVKTPFYGGYGLIAEDRIPKPAFNVFAMLHRLGDERIAEPQEDVLVTRRSKDGTLVIAAWNLVEPDTTGPNKKITLDLKNVPADAQATIYRSDAHHGDTMAAWNRMGKPRYPTEEQIAVLKLASNPGPTEVRKLQDGRLTISIPPKGLAVIELK
jgi:xylan 1,4-beta-xylosidase